MGRKKTEIMELLESNLKEKGNKVKVEADGKELTTTQVYNAVARHKANTGLVLETAWNRFTNEMTITVA